jgi:hypothetical protein
MTEGIHWKTVSTRKVASISRAGRSLDAELVYRNFGDKAGWQWSILRGDRKRTITSGHELSEQQAQAAVQEALHQIFDVPEQIAKEAMHES